MAKPKTSAAKRARPVAERKMLKTLGYRVPAPDLKWIGMVAQANRRGIPGLLDQAVVRYAKDLGSADAPPDRTA